MSRKLLITHNRSLGDVVVLTAAIRDLMLAHPNKFKISVSTSFQSIWANNPYIVTQEIKGLETIRADYGPYLKESRPQKIHFIQAFHKDLENKLKVTIPLTEPKPALFLSEEEKNTRIVEGNYVLMLAGHKTDFTTKMWSIDNYQTVVNALRALNIPVVQAGNNSSVDRHYPIEGTLNLVGKTNPREFMRLIYQSDLIICTITAAMHIAAAFDKPCVVTAGGRESFYWEGYYKDNTGLQPVANKLKVDHRFLHTIGLLDCCKEFGCWKNKVSKTEPDKHKSYCRYPERADNTDQIIPLCQKMITPEHVIEAVLSYYISGDITPSRIQDNDTSDRTNSG